MHCIKGASVLRRHMASSHVRFADSESDELGSDAPRDGPDAPRVHAEAGAGVTAINVPVEAAGEEPPQKNQGPPAPPPRGAPLRRAPRHALGHGWGETG